MSNLQGTVGELHFTVQVTRKETGETETHELVGFLDEAQRDALVAEGLIQNIPNTKEQ